MRINACSCASRWPDQCHTTVHMETYLYRCASFICVPLTMEKELHLAEATCVMPHTATGNIMSPLIPPYICTVSPYFPSDTTRF